MHRTRVEIDRDDLCHFHVYVGVAAKRTAQIESYIAWTEHRGGHLVKQRLELLIIVFVDQRDPNVGMLRAFLILVYSALGERSATVEDDGEGIFR